MQLELQATFDVFLNETGYDACCTVWFHHDLCIVAVHVLYLINLIKNQCHLSNWSSLAIRNLHLIHRLQLAGVLNIFDPKVLFQDSSISDINLRRFLRIIV